jgi:hypothetical protein
MGVMAQQWNSFIVDGGRGASYVYIGWVGGRAGGREIGGDHRFVVCRFGGSVGMYTSVRHCVEHAKEREGGG